MSTASTAALVTIPAGAPLQREEGPGRPVAHYSAQNHTLNLKCGKNPCGSILLRRILLAHLFCHV
jgi:hypothetical protein